MRIEKNNDSLSEFSFPYVSGVDVGRPRFYLVMGEIMRHCRKYGNIARRLIRTLPELEDIKESDVRIAYLSSQEEKIKNHKIVFGECHKVAKTYDWCCPYDFFIVLYEPNIAEFTPDQIETLIRHELHHVGIEYTDAGLSYYVVPHDVEEFWDIINDKGLDWSDTNA